MFDGHLGRCERPTEAAVLSKPSGETMAADLNAMRQDRSYGEATADIDWRMVAEAPIVDLPPCACGEELVDPVPDGFRCIACAKLR